MNLQLKKKIKENLLHNIIWGTSLLVQEFKSKVENVWLNSKGMFKAAV